MHELLDVRPWPRALLRYPLLILTALLLGALLAFSYSYAPLHRSKDWKIDYLEERLEIRSDQLRELEESLAQARASLDGRPSGEEITAIRTQLKQTTRLADSRENEVASLQKKLARATKSRDQWRSRHAAGLAEKQKQPIATVGEPAAESLAASESEPQAVPAAPAATARNGPDATPEADAPIKD